MHAASKVFTTYHSSNYSLPCHLLFSLFVLKNYNKTSLRHNKTVIIFLVNDNCIMCNISYQSCIIVFKEEFRCLQQSEIFRIKNTIMAAADDG